MKQAELRRLASIGAGSRLGELQSEIEAIYRTFPNLRAGKKGSTASTQAADGGSKPLRRKKMSAAARKAVGARMKKYWAARRAKENKAA
jgi:hypothetical protein